MKYDGVRLYDNDGEMLVCAEGGEPTVIFEHNWLRYGSNQGRDEERDLYRMVRMALAQGEAPVRQRGRR